LRALPTVLLVVLAAGRQGLGACLPVVTAAGDQRGAADADDCADGECDSGECDSCFSTRESDRYINGGACFFFSGMKPKALCGCVAGQCTFFVQTPEPPTGYSQMNFRSSM